MEIILINKFKQQNVMEIENCKIEFGENKDKDYLN